MQGSCVQPDAAGTLLVMWEESSLCQGGWWGLLTSRTTEGRALKAPPRGVGSAVSACDCSGTGM